MHRRTIRCNGNSITADISNNSICIVGITGKLNSNINSLVSRFMISMADSDVKMILCRDSDDKAKQFLRQVSGWKIVQEGLAGIDVPSNITREEVFAIQPKGC